MGIKMICSDLDGTILTYTQTKLSDRLFEQIRELNRRGVIFVPASGRQIISVQKLFEPVKESCYFVCSNGAVICDSNGDILEKITIPKEDAIAIADDFWNNTNGRGEVNISGAKCCHLMERGIGVVDRIKFIGASYDIVSSPDEVCEDIVKVSAFLPDGAQNYAEKFVDKWKKYNAAIAGEYWIDSTLASKGEGIKLLCDRLSILPDEVLAFGDNYNDISMLDMVGKAYIMQTATDELLDRYENHVSNVEDELDRILADM